MGQLSSCCRPNPVEEPTAPGKKPATITHPPLTANQTAFLKALPKAGIRGAIRTRGHINFAIDIIPWNLRCAPKPLALVYAVDAADVATAVKLAAQYAVPVQPRSGGHSFGSYSLGGKDGALVIDLEKMNKVVVDQKTWRATIGGGTRLKEVTSGLFDQGKRTIAHGTCPQVGIGGHATVGGQGPLSRMYGLTLDHLVEVEVVLADGTVTKASKDEKPDLFFALRGAGASFGIVTSFLFETHPAPTVTTHYSFQLTFGGPEELSKIFLKWQSFVSSPEVLNDRAFNSVINIASNIVFIQGSRMGSAAELQASEVAVRMKGEFEVDLVTTELDWLASILNWATGAIDSLAGALTIPLYTKSFSVRQSKLLTPDAVAAWFDYMDKHSPHDCVWVILGDLEAGRISDFPNDATAYSLRDALYTMCAYAIGPLPFPDDALAFMNGMLNTLTTAMPDAAFGVYPGYVDPLIPAPAWPTAYYGANYARLLDIKKKYDPSNVFSNPQSVGADQPQGALRSTGEVKAAFSVEGGKVKVAF
ncbi:Glucooligosaccharide oxidase [Sphaerobolus stellatus SS14]|uniref:Glucooligosaccharide oxidase n=1 Tax=Sphaerobolus stellatus (strain SS14) TaxID=990650 RepID=A0A0C9VDD8_SPHS4|nr:Glucooligosaccharide oxidase [Sphaerobolus stellatus SS14]